MASFDTGGWLGQGALIDATAYWTAAEARNGNSFPVKAKSSQEDVLVVRTLAADRLQVLHDGGLVDATFSQVQTRLDTISRQTLVAGAMASSAALLLVPHPDTPWPTLLRLAHLCVQLKVGNLWLATRDNRDGACRLLPLRLDNERTEDPWLGRSPPIPAETVRLDGAHAMPVLRFADGKMLAANAKDWGQGFAVAIAALKPRPRRMQVQLSQSAKVRDLEHLLNELAPAALAEIEPFWPMVDESPLLDATEYWKSAKGTETSITSTDPARALQIRLQGGGGVSVLEDAAWVACGLAGARTRLQALAQVPAVGADPAHVVCYMAPEAAWETLLELCRACVELRIKHLSLATTDKRTGVRLLTLFVDTAQAAAEWYAVPDSELPNLAGLAWYEAAPTFVLPGAKFVPAKSGKGWGKEFRDLLAQQDPRPRRLQIDLPVAASARSLEVVLREVATAGFDALEPFWPALRKTSNETLHERRKLADFDDTWNLSAAVQPPTMSEYWRAAEEGERLPLSATVDATRPLLLLKLDQDNHWASRTRQATEWTAHADDAQVQQELHTQAGEMDFDSGSSTLQVVLAVDRRARWEGLLGLLEMMVTARCRTLYVLVQDQLGPTLRLLDMSLPTDAMPADAAWVIVSREGIPEGGNYRAALKLGESEFTAEGPRFLAGLSRIVAEHKASPPCLVLRMPRDEPVGSCLFVVNALSRLEMLQIRISP
ncbi:MAG: hypothetical protein IPP14_12040 [Planctomycetes bacterium]|nr:hypothetical protein [Planctomycetota bacterium]